MKKHISVPFRQLVVATGIALVCVLAGCAKTEAPSQNIGERATGEQPAPVATSGFLKDYSQLKPGTEGQTLLVYINPNAHWSKYTKVIIDPVQFWADPNTSVPVEDQQTLCAYFYNVLKENLEKSYTIVDQPGPDVMRIQVALTDATAANSGFAIGLGRRSAGASSEPGPVDGHRQLRLRRFSRGRGSNHRFGYWRGSCCLGRQAAWRDGSQLRGTMEVGRRRSRDEVLGRKTLDTASRAQVRWASELGHAGKDREEPSFKQKGTI
jgi:hypothetical protein